MGAIPSPLVLLAKPKIKGDKYRLTPQTGTKQTFILPVDISPPAANLRTPLIQHDELNSRPVTRTFVEQ